MYVIVTVLQKEIIFITDQKQFFFTSIRKQLCEAQQGELTSQSTDAG